LLVSIVIPTYNSAPFLAETLACVRSQTHTDWELFLVDGGSQDQTWEIIQTYTQKDARIHAILQPGGVSASRNRGAAMAQGSIIAFLDSDDLWLPGKLAAHLKHFQSNPKLGVSFAQVEYVTLEGQSTGMLSRGKLRGLQPQDLLYENPTISMSNIAARREVLEQIQLDPAMSHAEDLEWLFRAMVLGGWEIAGINQVLLRYRTNTKGLSSNLYQMEAGWQRLIHKARDYAPNLVDQHYAAAESVQLRYLARQAFRLGLPAKVGVDFMTRSLQANWQITYRQPRRTALTAAAVYGTYILSLLKGKSCPEFL
jgi:glycosyltransferase involved in cell wall biosynthesis